MGQILAVCTSEKKGTVKRPVDSCRVREGHGLEGDAHAGDWHRQVSLLAQESVDQLRGKGFEITAGDFAENLLTEGIELKTRLIGTVLRVGAELRLRVTQIGKECHQGCAIRKLIGDCVMPREGIFAEVLHGGTARAGDTIEVEAEPESDAAVQGAPKTN